MALALTRASGNAIHGDKHLAYLFSEVAKCETKPPIDVAAQEFRNVRVAEAKIDVHCDPSLPKSKVEQAVGNKNYIVVMNQCCLC
jgi:hypothetical protein